MNITYDTNVAQADMADRHPVRSPAPAMSGHQADGSSIQNHSCGSHYPFVVGAQETERGLRWFVQAPDGLVRMGWTMAEAAIGFAEKLAEGHRARLRRETEARAVREISPERRTPWNDELPRDSLGRSGALPPNLLAHVRGMIELAEDGRYADHGLSSHELLLLHLRALERLLTR